MQGSATNYEAINFYREHFGIARAVLPRVLSLTQVEQVIEKTPVEIEVFGFGSLCVMVEGRCALSSLRHRRIAQHPRRVLAGQGGALGRNAAGPASRA